MPPATPQEIKLILAGELAHEINNPLTYVMANLELIERALRASRNLDRDDLCDLVSEATEGAERIRRAVARFQAIAPGESPWAPMFEGHVAG